MEEKTSLGFDRSLVTTFLNNVDKGEIKGTDPKAQEMLDYAYRLISEVAQLDHWAVHVEGY